MRASHWLPALLTALPSAAALAAPSAIKLSWASTDASTTMAISWVTPDNVPSTVEYGLLATSEHSITGAAPVELSGIGWLHEVELTQLAAASSYRYRVGASGDFSPEHTFLTAPNDGCQPFSFVQLGDARSQNARGPSPNWASIHQEAAAAGAAFILNGGDLVRDGADIAQWAAWLQDSQMVNPLVPMMPAIGNHDDGPGDGNSANYNQLFVLPNNTVTGTEDYYYFVYNNALIFSLSTQTFEDYQAQSDWLVQVAQQHPTKWKLVYFHHPVYTTQTTIIIDVGHPPNEKGQNPYYGPAFDAAGIDVVFQSHNHIYERFRPLRYDPANPESGMEVPSYGNGAGEGRLYVVSGGSGSFLDPLIEGSFVHLANGSEARSKDHHFMKISIAGNTLHYQAVRTNAGNTSGGGTLIDELTLTRPGPDPCAQPNDPDNDGDGYPRSRDCDDADASRNPGQIELCGNNIDEDCDQIAQTCPVPPVDMDGDGSPAGTDCDDNDPNRSPEKTEIDCDGVDNNCDCLSECNLHSTDVCAPPDAGQPADAAPPAADASLAPDAATGADAARADAATPATLEDQSCTCDDTRGSSQGAPPLLLALSLLALLRARRR